MQKLEQAKQVTEQKAKQAADKSAAMMEYQNRVQSGEDPNSVMMEIGPRMGGSLSGMASVSRAAQATAPKSLEFQKEGDNTFYHSSKAEPWKHMPNAHADLALGNTIVSHTMSQISGIERELETEGINKKVKEGLESRLTEKKLMVNKVAKQRKQAIPFPEVETDSGSSSSKAKHKYIYGKGIVPIEEEQAAPTEETDTGE
jgi:hypothetical protein